MSKTASHIIDKINAELSSASAKPMAEEHDVLKSEICRALENIKRVFDQEYDDAYYRLERLTVDVDIYEEDMPYLSEILEDKLLNNIRSEHKKAPNNFSEGKKGLKTINADDRMMDLSIHFLRTGQFPWWAAHESILGIEDWLNNINQKKWQELTGVLRDEKTNALQRLVLQFPKAVLDKLIYLSTDPITADKILRLLYEIEQFLNGIDLSYGYSQQLMYGLYRHIFSNLFRGCESRDLLASTVREMIRSVEAAEDENCQLILQQWTKWLQINQLEENNVIPVLEELGPLKSDFSSVIYREGLDNRNWLQADEDYDIAVDNAGLVLLHPFLEKLFENIGLMDGGIFSSGQARRRGVCILHFIATGDDEIDEQKTLVPKLLCGLPFDVPVYRFLAISEYEKDECARLLEALAASWETHESISIAKLRRNLFQLRGVLERAGGSRTLYLQETPDDFLLEQYPWDLSFIKQDWTEGELAVQW